ncbi:hypothetical protein [Nostoc sp.]
MALMVKIILSLPEKVIRHTSGIGFYNRIKSIPDAILITRSQSPS